MNSSKVFAKIVHSNQLKQDKYDRIEAEREMKGPIGFMVRHKKASVICGVSMAALIIIGIGTCIFLNLFKAKLIKNKIGFLISEIALVSIVILLFIIMTIIFIKKCT